MTGRPRAAVTGRAASAAGGSGDRVSPARKPPPKRRADSPKTDPRKPLPEELARDAIAHEEEAAEGKVRMTLRVLLARPYAEALAARAIREEKNIGTVVTEILEGAAGRTGHSSWAPGLRGWAWRGGGSGGVRPSKFRCPA